jgi:hypothetical protein
MPSVWQENCDSGHFCHSYPAAVARTLLSMLLITCPVTRTDELVADRRIRSVTNHATHIAMHVECPACGSVHTYRTGRRHAAAAATAPPAALPVAADELVSA